MAEKGKVGRPRIEHVRNKPVTIRLTEAEYQKLVEYSKSRNLTITKVIEEGLDMVMSKK